jgi:anti-sigma B factor antagonist
VADQELVVTVEELTDRAGSGALVRVAGEVDIETSPVLEVHLQAVADEGQTSVTVDLTEVSFLDSTGLSVLIGALKRCQGAGGELRLVAPQPNVMRVLEITGLTGAFHLTGKDDVSD